MDREPIPFRLRAEVIQDKREKTKRCSSSNTSATGRLVFSQT